jgi:hypothetical protein
MAIELNPQGMKRYMHLVSNPVYYFHAFQFTGGMFYRAWLGYERIWDLAYEETLMKALDAFLNYVAKRREYFLEQIEVRREFKMFGIKWKRGIKPTNYQLADARPVWIEKGRTALARVNLLDTPRHVDIQFDDSDEIYTVSFTRYQNYKLTDIRSLRNAKANQQLESKQGGASSPNAEQRADAEAERPGEGISSRDYPDNVLDLRPRLGRKDSLRKAHKKTSTSLV